MGPSERRLGLTFFPPVSGRVTLSCVPVVADGQGLVLEAGQSPIRFTREGHGDIVTQGWYALYASPPTNGVSWIEEMLCNDFPTFYG